MPDHLFDTRVVELEKRQYNKPIIFGGFVGPGLVGLVTAGYIIEKLNLHEVAHVRSEHIPPVVVFVGAKLRHPFRIYSDDSGRIMAVICEMPIDIEGLYETSMALLDWAEQVKASEFVILDGVPVSGIPKERNAMSVANETRIKDLENKGIGAIRSAMISGIGGSILNQCLTRKVNGVSILTLVSVDIPDPGAALILVKAVNQIYGVGIGTEELEQDVQRLNARLGELAEQYKKLGDQSGDREKLQAYG
jgi:uncharacterized protein